MLSKKFPMSAFFGEEMRPSLVPHSEGLSVYEEGDNLVIEAALPGLLAEGIEVTHAHGYILIEGEKKEEETKRKYYRKATHSFFYRVPIPPGVDMQQEPEAVYADGIMRIIFKKGAKKGKTIPVKEG